MKQATETKTVAEKVGTKKPLPQEARGLVTQYFSYLEREGYPQETQYPAKIKRLARVGVNLLDPESVKSAIGKMQLKNGTKIQYVYAYDSFCKMLKIAWEKPHYTQEEIIPFIPYETELDALIAACRSKRMAAFLQSCKETFGDPS